MRAKFLYHCRLCKIFNLRHMWKNFSFTFDTKRDTITATTHMFYGFLHRP